MSRTNKYTLAVFDLDGTILDTLADLRDSLNAALTQNGLPQRSTEQVRSFVGNGIRRLVELGVPSGSSLEMTDKVFADFKSYYQIHCADQTAPYEGIKELLTRLKAEDIRTAVVSNKADSAVKVLCEQYFGDAFETAVGEREGIARKPAPDTVNEVLRELGVSRENAVYIGDSEVDIATARNAQMDAIIVTWGFRDESFLKEKGAQTIVHAPGEIADIVLR